MIGIVPKAAHKPAAQLRTNHGRGLLFVVTATITVVAPLLLPMSAYYLNLLMQASTYAVAVLGLTVVLGYTGQINLAQAAFFGLGAYSVALGTVSFGLPFWPALFAGIGIASIAGVVLGLASLRFGGHYLAMVTISFQQILTLVLTNWISLTRGPDGIPGIARPIVFGFSFADSGAYLAFCVGVLWVVGISVGRLKHTRLGRAMQAVRDNELAAGVVGVDTYRTKVVAFTLCALLGGLGGGLFAGGFTYISPDQFSFAESVVFFTMALLGGVRSPYGTAVGTALLILLPEWLRFLKTTYLAVYGGAVILIMVFMPEGIWGFLETLRRLLWPPAVLPLGQVAPLPLTTQSAREDDSIILQVNQLSKHFGGLNAVDEAELSVRRNTVHALVGPNGSGKTTLLNVLSGIYKPTKGRLFFEDQPVTRLLPHERTGRGIGRTFQNVRLFKSMSVLENAIIGAERPGNGVAVGSSGVEQYALAALDFVSLTEFRGAAVQSLSYGHQRLAEIARALAGSPKLLLLDEPGAGLNTVEKSELVQLLKRLKGHGLTILVIDHDMSLVEQVADRITVLNFGRRIADGPPVEVLSNPEVMTAYLGNAKPHVAT
jgi:branched-chain amino acid transport system permease protein